MLIFETVDNNGNELTVEGENKPLSFHYDNEFMKMTIGKNGITMAEVNLNHEDLVKMIDELENYLILVETKKNMSDNRRNKKLN